MRRGKGGTVPRMGLRVGVFSPYSLTVPGGVQGQVLGLARALRNLGHEVQVLGPSDGPPPEPGVIPLGNSVPLAANGSVAPIAPDPSAAARTIRALRDERFDVIHLHEPFVPGCNMTALLYKPCPVVATFHAAGTSASYRYLRPALRWLSRRITVRAAVSPAAVDMARRVIGRNADVELLWNGIEVDRALSVAPWPKPDGAPVVLFVGRHEHRKGLAVLLEAFHRLPADVRLWVAGVGPQTEELRARTKDPRIEWLGRINEDEKLRRMRAASVYCAPSLGGESFGVVLLEAMAAATAVVASDIDGYRNVAVHERNALMAEPGDPASLAKAIERVLYEKDLARSLIEHGNLRAEECSMERLAERYVHLYGRARRLEERLLAV